MTEFNKENTDDWNEKLRSAFIFCVLLYHNPAKNNRNISQKSVFQYKSQIASASCRKNYYTIFLPESTEKLIIFQTISKVFTALCALGWSMLNPSMSQRYC